MGQSPLKSARTGFESVLTTLCVNLGSDYSLSFNLFIYKMRMAMPTLQDIGGFSEERAQH